MMRIAKRNMKKQTQFAKGIIYVSVYMKGGYEDSCGFGRRKNKANSKPILFSPQIYLGVENQFEKTKPIYSYCVLCDAFCDN